MKKILVPVDFSDTSLHALNYALQLFKDREIEITVLHTYDTSSSAAFRMKSMDHILERDAQREMEKLMKKMEKEAQGAAMKPKIVKGKAVSTITRMGDSKDYDLIIMGTKGASGLKEVFMGSVAGGVIIKTQAPVLVVPEDYKYHPLDEVVFAMSGTGILSDTIITPLRDLIQMNDSKLNVLHISEEENPNLKDSLKMIEDLNPSVTIAFDGKNVHKALNDYVVDKKASLLCMVRRKRGFFGRIFGESATLKQTFDSPIPLLVLHDNS